MEHSQIRYEVTSLWKRCELDTSRRVYARTRISNRDQPVILEPKIGMLDSSDWHLSRSAKEHYKVADPHNRALLLHTQENTRELQAQFPHLDALREHHLNDNLFGENVVMKLVDPPSRSDNVSTCDLLCIGDILEIHRDGEVVGAVQVSSPRKPCYKVDRRCGVTDKRKQGSVQRFCVDRSLAGVLCAVLGRGSLCVGDVLMVKKRLHSDLTLRYVAGLCYGGQDNKRLCVMKKFMGTDAEYRRLVTCAELAEFEWKDGLRQWKGKQGKGGDGKGTAWLAIDKSMAMVFLVAVTIFFMFC